MIVNKQNKIRFINDCDCIFDEDMLRSAIMWFQKKPTASVKHIYMHGYYPAVSIHETKIHVHRLLMSYWNNRILQKEEVVHHKNGNKKDASISNLVILKNGTHLSYHNKGKILSRNTREAIVETNKKRNGKRAKPHRPDVTPMMVYNLRLDGLSFNEISKRLNLDWGCVMQRYKDAIHDNPELIKQK